MLTVRILVLASFLNFSGLNNGYVYFRTHSPALAQNSVSLMRDSTQFLFRAFLTRRPFSTLRAGHGMVLKATIAAHTVMTRIWVGKGQVLDNSPSSRPLQQTLIKTPRGGLENGSRVNYLKSEEETWNRPAKTLTPAGNPRRNSILQTIHELCSTQIRSIKSRFIFYLESFHRVFMARMVASPVDDIDPLIQSQNLLEV